MGGGIGSDGETVMLFGSVPPYSSMIVQLAEFGVGDVAQLRLPYMSCENWTDRDGSPGDTGVVPVAFRRYWVAGVVPVAPGQHIGVGPIPRRGPRGRICRTAV